MSATVLEGPWCSALGCRDPADVVINHPNGQRTVCDDCAGDHEVVRDV